MKHGKTIKELYHIERLTELGNKIVNTAENLPKVFLQYNATFTSVDCTAKQFLEMFFNFLLDHILWIKNQPVIVRSQNLINIKDFRQMMNQYVPFRSCFLTKTKHFSWDYFMNVVLNVSTWKESMWTKTDIVLKKRGVSYGRLSIYQYPIVNDVKVGALP